MPRNELTISAEQEDTKAFDDAWNEDVTDDDFEDEDDGDTTEEEAAEADDFEDETDNELDENEDDDQADEDDDKEDDKGGDSKEQQRYKSWEGRLKAEETRLKAEREAFERTQKEGQQQKENDSEDDQDTDDSPDEFEEEFPEVAEYLKKHIQPLREQVTQSQIDDQRKAAEAHLNRITASHPDAVAVAQSDDFKSWIENQPYKKATEYVHIQQNGTPEQVIAMLDDFKTHKPTKQSHANSASSVVKTRRTAKPRGRVAKDDFDGAWEEANRK